jgi:hypothetical protein
MAPQVQALLIEGRPAVVYSEYDITCALLGNPNPYPFGLTPNDAYDVMARLVVRLSGMELPKETQAANPAGR